MENDSRATPLASPALAGERCGEEENRARVFEAIFRPAFAAMKVSVQLIAVFAAMRLLTTDAPNARIVFDTFVALRALATLAPDISIEL